MKRVFLLAAVALLLNGCLSYRGGSLGPPDLAEEQPGFGRGTSGVSSGADPGMGITGSDLVPPRGP